MTDGRRRTGTAGEDAAAELVAATGMTVLERGYRSGRGEVDIVAVDGDQLVFIEVKASVGDFFGSPVLRVTPAKRQRLVKLAQRYLLERGRDDAAVRFDIVSVVFEQDGTVRSMEHLKDAFIRE